MNKPLTTIRFYDTDCAIYQNDSKVGTYRQLEDRTLVYNLAGREVSKYGLKYSTMTSTPAEEGTYPIEVFKREVLELINAGLLFKEVK